MFCGLAALRCAWGSYHVLCDHVRIVPYSNVGLTGNIVNNKDRLFVVTDQTTDLFLGRLYLLWITIWLNNRHVRAGNRLGLTYTEPSGCIRFSICFRQFNGWYQTQLTLFWSKYICTSIFTRDPHSLPGRCYSTGRDIQIDPYPPSLPSLLPSSITTRRWLPIQ